MRFPPPYVCRRCTVAMASGASVPVKAAVGRCSTGMSQTGQVGQTQGEAKGSSAYAHRLSATQIRGLQKPVSCVTSRGYHSTQGECDAISKSITSPIQSDRLNTLQRCEATIVDLLRLLDDIGATETALHVDHARNCLIDEIQSEQSSIDLASGSPFTSSTGWP